MKGPNNPLKVRKWHFLQLWGHYSVLAVCWINVYDYTYNICIIIHVDIEFNPAKNQANVTKQGVSLADVESLEWETAVVVQDARQAYGEIRMISTGYIGDRLHVAVFVDRGTIRRIISLRKANEREVNRYAET